MGASIAMHAASRCDPLKEPVILLEKESLGAGSSGRAQAIIHQGYSDRGLAGMSRDALKFYAGFEANTGRSIGFRQTGVLFLAGAEDPALREGLERDIAMQISLGIDVRRIDADEIRHLVHGIDVSDDTIGAFEREAGFVDPVRTIESIATLARSRGAVTRIGVKDPTVLVKDGRAVGVETSAGTFYAPQVVLATGPWTGIIMKELGVDLPLRVARTEQHYLEMPQAPVTEDEGGLPDSTDPVVADFETRFTPDPFARLPVPHPVIIDLEKGFFARCEPRRNRTRVGRWGFKGLEEVADPDAMTSRVNESFARWARETITARVPMYGDQKDVGSRAAWITLTPDEKPIIGPITELPGLYVVTGFNGNDFQLAPSIGEGLAQMLLEQPVSAFDPEQFSLKRFLNV